MGYRNILWGCLFVTQEATGKLDASTAMTLLAGFGEIVQASHRRIRVVQALYIVNTVTISAGCRIQLGYLVGTQLYGFAMKATHI